MASAFGATFDELWEQLPGDDEIKEKLREWGIYDPGLSVLKLRERFCRFDGVEFGIAPAECWPELRRDLLQFESRLACRQSDVGLVAKYPFDPRVRPGTKVF